MRLSHAAVAAVLGQMAVLGWFNANLCLVGEEAGTTGFVGGLGVVYALFFGYLASIALGAAGYVIDRRQARAAS